MRRATSGGFSRIRTAAVEGHLVPAKAPPDGVRTDKELQDDAFDLPSRLSLPAPPLLDRQKLAARQKFRTPKSRPNKQAVRTPLQEELRKNPYANLLTAPVRACGITSTRLPASFFVEFDAYEHPKTGQPWLLPKSMFRVRRERGKHLPDIPHAAATCTPSSDDTLADRSSLGKSRTTSSGLVGRALAQETVIARCTNDRKSWRRIYNPSYASKTGIRDHHLVWREDMPDFILDQLRLWALDRLQYCLDRKGYIQEWPVDTRIPSQQVGCVLWLERDSDSNAEREQKDVECGESDCGRTWVVDAVSGAELAGEIPPTSQYAFLRAEQCGRKVRLPVYNADQLLGAEHLATFKAAVVEAVDPAGLGQCSRVVLKQKLGSVDANQALWKLKGYMEGSDLDRERIQMESAARRRKIEEHKRVRLLSLAKDSGNRSELQKPDGDGTQSRSR